MNYDDKSISVDEDMIVPNLLINNNALQQQSLWPVSDDFYDMKYLDDEAPNPCVSPPSSRPTDIRSSWISSPFQLLDTIDFYYCVNYSAYLNARVQWNTPGSWNLEAHSQSARLSWQAGSDAPSVYCQEQLTSRPKRKKRHFTEQEIAIIRHKRKTGVCDDFRQAKRRVRDLLYSESTG